MGSNHDGRFSAALDLVRATAKAGADCVKFQLFKWEDVSEVPHLYDRKYELQEEWIPKLQRAALDEGIDFLCTPFATWSVELLRPYVGAWKIGSFEALRSDLILATMDKVRIISLGRCTEDQRKKLWNTLPNAIFLHCVSSYPTRLQDSALWRLRKMKAGRKETHAGISDHTAGWESVAAAVGMGVHTVEKHIKLESQRKDDTPDSGSWSLTPARFKTMVRVIRQLSAALKEPKKQEFTEFFGRREHWGKKII